MLGTQIALCSGGQSHAASLGSALEKVKRVCQSIYETEHLGLKLIY